MNNLWDRSIDHKITWAPNEESKQEIIVNSEKNFYVLQIDSVNTAIAKGSVQFESPGMSWEESLNNMRVLDTWREAIGLRYILDSRSETNE